MRAGRHEGVGRGRVGHMGARARPHPICTCNEADAAAPRMRAHAHAHCLQDCVEAVAAFAWKASPYPVTITIENHMDQVGSGSAWGWLWRCTAGLHNAACPRAAARTGAAPSLPRA